MSWLIFYTMIAIVIFIIIVFTSVSTSSKFCDQTVVLKTEKKVNLKLTPLTNEFKSPTPEELELYMKEREQIRLAINSGDLIRAREIAIVNQSKPIAPTSNRYQFSTSKIKD